MVQVVCVKRAVLFWYSLTISENSQAIFRNNKRRRQVSRQFKMLVTDFGCTIHEISLPRVVKIRNVLFWSANIKQVA